MALNEKELLTGLLSAAYQMDETGVASLYNEDGSLKDDALDTLKKVDADRVTKSKPDTKKFFDDGYKKATSESLTKYEQNIQEAFKIKSDKKGIELISEIISAQSKANGQELNEDAIKKHPLYISTVDRLSKEKEDSVKIESEKLIKFQTEIQKEKVFTAVSSKAMDIFNSLKPVLSQDPIKAKNQLIDFAEKLKTFEYDMQGDQIVVLKDGKVLEDSHGHRILFEKVVKDTAERYYDFHIVDPKKTPSNNTDDKNKGKKTATLEAPKNSAEYFKTVGDSSIPLTERNEYIAKYEKQFYQTT